MSLTDPSDLEPELERLLEKYVPDMASNWSRASDHDIATLEAIAGRELPRCYRWMLLRLGRGWADIAYGSLDLSAQAVTQGYARKAFPELEGMMCIALDTDSFQPQLRYYDLAHGTDDDAPVFEAGPEDDELSAEYETLREFIGVAVFSSQRVDTLPIRVEGIFISEEGSSALDEFEHFVEDHGYRAPLTTGRFCTAYDDGEVAISSYSTPAASTRRDLLPFRLGGPSEGELRKFLGLLATGTSLRAHHLLWHTPTA